jgi:hypothetical protein
VETAKADVEAKAVSERGVKPLFSLSPPHPPVSLSLVCVCVSPLRMMATLLSIWLLKGVI